MNSEVNMTLDFLTDWKFWAVVLSATGIVLSQIPPLHLLFRRAKLDVNPYSRFHITQKVGNPNLQIHLKIQNVGGRPVKIQNLTVEIIRDKVPITNIGAQSFIKELGDKSNALFTGTVLRPGDEWEHICQFFNPFDRETERRFKKNVNALRSRIIELREMPGNKDKLVEAEESLVQPFTEQHKKLFIWIPGEYELALKVKTSATKADTVRRYLFTVFESDTDELNQFADDYKSGDGIYWDSAKHPGVFLQFSEKKDT